MNKTADEMISNKLDRIYDSAFFREWGRDNKTYISSAEIVTDILYREFKPASIADLGCGCGLHSFLFSNKGARVLSIDGVSPPPEFSFPVTIHKMDLTVPFENKWGIFDMTLCLEVAEHIKEKDTGIFLDNIIRFSELLVFSAAPPNQTGHHHVNCRPKRYWTAKLAAKGFIYNRKLTGRLMEAFKKNRPEYMWMCEQISVYEKKQHPEKYGNRLPFSYPRHLDNDLPRPRPVVEINQDDLLPGAQNDSAVFDRKYFQRNSLLEKTNDCQDETKSVAKSN